MKIKLPDNVVMQFSMSREDSNTFTFESADGSKSFTVTRYDGNINITSSDTLQSDTILSLNPSLRDEIELQIVKEQVSGVENEEDYKKSNEPFDTDKISIESKTVALDTLLRRLKQGNVRLSPDFQRREIWTVEQKSRLIESLLLKIPIPMFYVASDQNSIWSVVDGQQRMSAIRDFIIGIDFQPEDVSCSKTMKLKGLEFLNDLNGKRFDELSVNLQNRIYETEFKFTIVNPGTPEVVKRNIFKRLNTGGEPLSEQEIRNALYQGRATLLLKRLISLDSFVQSVGKYVSNARMATDEIVLRCISFFIRNYNEFKKEENADNWLSVTMEMINKRNDEIWENTIVHSFDSGVRRSMQILGEHAFRRSFDGDKKSPINKVLFEMWTVCLSLLNEDQFQLLLSRKDSLIKGYRELLRMNEFSRAVSRDGLIRRAIMYRYNEFNNLLNQTIE